MAFDCFQTLAHLYSIKLAHTDLKPENILFTAPGRPDVTSGTVSLTLSLTLTLTLNPSSPSPSTVASTSASALSGPTPQQAGLAIIDFGGATWEHEHHSSIVCTRQYRPAEVTYYLLLLTAYTALLLSTYHLLLTYYLLPR